MGFSGFLVVQTFNCQVNKEGKIYFTELQGEEKGYDEAAKVYEELKK